MSDNQENKLPDATTNQSTENEISVNETKNEKIKPEVVNTTEEKAEIKLKPAAVEVKKEIKEETVETNKEVEVETKVEKKIEDASTKEPKEESKEEPKEEPN